MATHGHLPRATRFYDPALAPLRLIRRATKAGEVGYGLPDDRRRELFQASGQGQGRGTHGQAAVHLTDDRREGVADDVGIAGGEGRRDDHGGLR